VLNVAVNMMDYQLGPAAATDVPRVLGKNGPALPEPVLAGRVDLMDTLRARGFEIRQAETTRRAAAL
jgi:gamma-glutamyltranspeptidase